MDFLVPHPNGKWLVTNPSTSPENFPDGGGNKPYFDEVIILPYVTKSGNIFHCVNCDHSWTSRIAKIPIACPKCKRYFKIEDEKRKTKTN